MAEPAGKPLSTRESTAWCSRWVSRAASTSWALVERTVVAAWCPLVQAETAVAAMPCKGSASGRIHNSPILSSRNINRLYRSAEWHRGCVVNRL